MLNQSQLDELSHEDRLQRELALTFARSLHAHTCSVCRMLRTCLVVGCEFRKFPAKEREYECFVCRGVDQGVASHATVVEWAEDEAAGGGDE